jgi:hypothetical protein
MPEPDGSGPSSDALRQLVTVWNSLPDESRTLILTLAAVLERVD